MGNCKSFKIRRSNRILPLNGGKESSEFEEKVVKKREKEILNLVQEIQSQKLKKINEEFVSIPSDEENNIHFSHEFTVEFLKERYIDLYLEKYKLSEIPPQCVVNLPNILIPKTRDSFCRVLSSQRVDGLKSEDIEILEEIALWRIKIGQLLMDLNYPAFRAINQFSRALKTFDLIAVDNTMTTDIGRAMRSMETIYSKLNQSYSEDFWKTRRMRGERLFFISSAIDFRDNRNYESCLTSLREYVNIFCKGRLISNNDTNNIDVDHKEKLQNHPPHEADVEVFKLISQCYHLKKNYEKTKEFHEFYCKEFVKLQKESMGKKKSLILAREQNSAVWEYIEESTKNILYQEELKRLAEKLKGRMIDTFRNRENTSEPISSVTVDVEEEPKNPEFVESERVSEEDLGEDDYTIPNVEKRKLKESSSGEVNPTPPLEKGMNEESEDQNPILKIGNNEIEDEQNSNPKNGYSEFENEQNPNPIVGNSESEEEQNPSPKAKNEIIEESNPKSGIKDYKVEQIEIGVSGEKDSVPVEAPVFSPIKSKDETSPVKNEENKRRRKKRRRKKKKHHLPPVKKKKKIVDDNPFFDSVSIIH